MADWGKRMNNTGSLAESVMKKQELAEREEELTRESIEDSINTRLQKHLKQIPNGEFLEALRANKYLYVCLKMPMFENKLTRIGRIYTEVINKILTQQNETNPGCLFEIETNKITINYILRSRKRTNYVGNIMNTFVIHITGKKPAEKSIKIT